MASRNRPTLRDVAQAAGVSPSAVSMILNRRSGVSFTKEVRQRVIQTAEDIGYKKSGATARHFDAPTIAVVLTIITGSYYTAMSQAISQQAALKGYDTVCFETHRNKQREARLLSMIEKGGFSGVIFTVPPTDANMALRLNKVMPVVVVSSVRGDNRLDTVLTDDYCAGTMLAKHLLELGHRHAAFLEFSRKWQSVTENPRLEGVRDAFLAQQGATLSVVSRPAPNTLSPGSFLDMRAMGREMAPECIKDRRVTAIIAKSDYAAYGVMEALSEKGLRIPEDYSLCGFDDIFASALPGVSLTSVNRHPMETGVNSFELLYKKMAPPDNGRQAPACITCVEYVSRLMVRGSTGAPKKG